MQSTTGKCGTITERLRTVSAGLLAALVVLLFGRSSYGQNTAQVGPADEGSAGRLRPVSASHIGYMDVGDLGEQWGEGHWGGGPPQGPRPE
jgi:hypothetical protein